MDGDQIKKELLQMELPACMALENERRNRVLAVAAQCSVERQQPKRVKPFIVYAVMPALGLAVFMVAMVLPFDTPTPVVKEDMSAQKFAWEFVVEKQLLAGIKTDLKSVMKVQKRSEPSLQRSVKQINRRISKLKSSSGDRYSWL